MNASAEVDPGTGHKRLNLCLVCSPGGHLAELETISDGLDAVDRFLVTVETNQTRSALVGVRRLFVRRIERNPVNLIVNAVQALSILIRERPDAVLSTGAGDAVPLMLLAVGLGIPVVFAESVARVHHPSLTGRLVRHWVDLTIIPWPTLKAAFPRSICVAPLVAQGFSEGPLPSSPSVIVLTGTGPRGFDRLVRGVDRLVRERELKATVYAQIGSSTYLPENMTYDRFLSHERLVAAIQSSDLVITHCGAGSIRESLAAGKRTIVVPRDPLRGEVTYRSGAELARHLEDLGWVTVVADPSEIPSALARTQSLAAQPLRITEPVGSKVIAGFLDGLRGSSE